MLKYSAQRGKHFVVGLMSGTSADGIDAVVAEIAGTRQALKVRLLAHKHTPFTRELRQRILHACLHGTVAEICELNFLLGEHFARATSTVIKKAGLSPDKISVVGSHGQTVHHLPLARYPSTLQIGEPSVIAERTGITTVADFRVMDMAAGGQGAPLVPYVDWAMFTHRTRPRILQNIGGIGNLTFLPAKAELTDVQAFDTGPGNMPIDAVTGILSSGKLSFDDKGAWAAQGKVSKHLLGTLMAHPYLRRKPPKTTGREEFGEIFVKKLLRDARGLRLPPEDILATTTMFTAASIAHSYKRFIFPKLNDQDKLQLQVILGGGGAKNEYLKKILTELVFPATVLTQDDLGHSNAAKEALAFAVLAHETMNGQPTNVLGATGARRPKVLGKIIVGSCLD